ncbi:MAG: hypothetical protein GX066_00135 [Clostridiaceae bacterium]|nr:hypothetical protein [Clostridiaceae bacterium]
MMEILVQSLICFFALYGVIQLGLNIYNMINDYKLEKDKVYIIITVKNQQDTIEGVIRSIVWKSLNNYHGGVIPNILVVDMGSTDDTPIILDKLCLEYDFIKVTNSKEYINVLEKMIN